MRNIANPSVKFLDLSDTILAKLGFFGSNLTIAPSKIHGKCFSKLNNKFAMTLFYDQIRQDLPTYVEQSMTSNDPFIAGSSMSFVSRFFKSCTTSSFKGFLKPVKETNIGVGDFQNGSIMTVFIAVSGFVFKLASVKTSFAVDNTCKISKMKRIVNFWFIKNPMFMIDVIELHDTSYGYGFIN